MSKICLRLYSAGIPCEYALVKFLLTHSSSTRVAWSLYHRHKKPPLNSSASSEGIHQGRSMNLIIQVSVSVSSKKPTHRLLWFLVVSYCSYPFETAYNNGCDERHKNHCDTHLIEYVLPVHYCLPPGRLGSFNSLILALIRHLLRLHCITKLRVSTSRVVAHQM